MTLPLSLDLAIESLPLAKPFRISGHVFTDTPVVLVTLSDGTHSGRGEASGVYYLGDDVPAMAAAIESVRGAVKAGATREQLQTLLPAGGARNALDCALWELDARRSGVPVWEVAGLAEPRPLRTTFTLGADDPGVMAEGARGYAQARALKLKLTGDLDLDIARVQAVRAARPECWIGVDANQGFAIGDLDKLVAALVAADVKLLEQPLARGREADLTGYQCPIPIAADESALTLADVEGLVGRFDVVNIKLDKCGGLTEGLAIAQRARELGLGVMVGNMVGSSLAMAPAFIVGQLCDIVDLDGPIFLADDRKPSIEYTGGDAWCGEAIWGREVG
ncbi:enolase superfamily enzyme related to L-alanine-DL-glutamate epimerase [Sphingopyxis fribergensis]|uniref:Dipeptide epimerase n=1 Tax=Sphingopyxis fribergensis TaxID=1515612 RepID=A0A0A7PDM3_9SPHN|nr:dipeptide epimerase [Sphingopyxis fribergensis]AJA08110.1 enolase superfamily enzyme related to L-alanine-DL-glutamate epimerase [Sphingopyxis fribergensis]